MKYGSAAFGLLQIDGFDLLGAKPKGFSQKKESILEPAHGLGDSSVVNTPVGVQQVTFSQEGAFFDDATNGMHLTLRASGATIRILTAAPFGNTIGKYFTGAAGVYMATYEVINKIAELTKANATYTIAGQTDDGIIVQHATAKTADWNTKSLGTPVDHSTSGIERNVAVTSSSVANPSVITTATAHGMTTGESVVLTGHSGSTPSINGTQYLATVTSTTTFTIPVNVTVGGTGGTVSRVSTAGGGVGYMSVSAFSGFTGFVGKIQMSPDDVTYATTVTFTNVTSGPTAQRVTSTGIIDRFLSFDGDVTGSGSITVFAGFARSG
jgi:hypothetical protein